MRLLICITGKTGSGKSTLLDSLAMRGWRTLSTGAIFRATKSKIEELDSNCIAPESFDETVRDEIEAFLSKYENMEGPCLCAVEAFPRKPEQISHLVELSRRKGWICICLVVSANSEVRCSRVASRDIGNGDRLKLDCKKMEQEEALILINT